MSLSIEDMQVKKATILKYINTGLGAETAYTLAGVTDAEREELVKDTSFQEFLTQGSAQFEFELLQSVNTVRLYNEKRGKSDEARWLLGVINPARYAGKKEVSVGNGSVTISFGKDYDGV